MSSKERWYEHGERNSKYFYTLEKRTQKKKHITSLVNNDGDKITNPKDILEEEERYFEEKLIENALSEEIAKMCEGVMSIDECEIELKIMENEKTPGTDGLTPEFYH